MKTVTIRDEEWDTEYVSAMLSGMRDGEFHRATWSSRDALVTKDGVCATVYTGQRYDSNKMELRRSFWDHDHCEVCNWLLTDSQGEEHSVGYFNGYNWLCEECYRLFIDERKAEP